jgi:hypothetical protein
VSIPASDPLGDALDQHAHDQIIATFIGAAPAGGKVGAPDPLSDIAWSHGVAQHFDESGNPAPHPAGIKPGL